MSLSKYILILLAATLPLGDLGAAELVTPEFRFQLDDPKAIRRAASRTAKELAPLVRGSDRPTAKSDLQIARVLEAYVGHHPLTIRFYRRALESSAGPARDQSVHSEATQALARLGRLRLEALKPLAGSTQPYYSPSLIALGERESVKVTLAGPKESTTEGDDLFYVVDIAEGGYIVRSHRHPEYGLLRINAGQVQAVLLVPRPYQVSYQPGRAPLFKRMREDLNETLRDSVFNRDGEDIINNTPVIRWEISRSAAEDASPPSYTSLQKYALYGDFLETHPELKDEIWPHFDHVYFEMVMSEGERAGLSTYFGLFPEGQHTTEVASAIEDIDFSEAQSVGTLEAYRSFLSTYPSTRYRSQAEDAIEAEGFRLAKAEGSRLALEHFLSEYPSGRFSAEARDAIDRHNFLEARNTNTIAGYEGFISTYPDSAYTEKARAAIAEIRSGQEFSRVRRTNTRAAYERFLAGHPNSSWVNEARAMIAFFTAKSSRDLADYETFFDLYRSVEVRAVVQAEYRSALGKVLQEVELEARNKDRGARAHALAHRETGEVGYLRQAWNLKIIETPAVELYVLRNLDPEEQANVFHFAERQRDYGVTGDLTWFWATPVISSRPEVEAVFASAARFRYLIEVELHVQVDYERYFFGARWLAPDGESKRWSETYRSSSSAVVELGPLPEISTPVRFRFPELELYRQTGPDLYSYRTEGSVGDPRHTIISIRLADR